jgi:hypothetical protein
MIEIRSVLPESSLVLWEFPVERKTRLIHGVAGCLSPCKIFERMIYLNDKFKGMGKPPRKMWVHLLYIAEKLPTEFVSRVREIN